MKNEEELKNEEEIVNIPTEDEINQYNMETMAETGDGTSEPEPEPTQTEGNGDLSKYDLPKNRRKKTMRYGLKEVADVIFFDIGTKRPVLIFDTLKVSNIENASESTEATGGKGNSPLVSWDYGRTATLTMQDALLSDQSLAMLAGSEVKDANTEGVKVTRHDIVIAGAEGAVKLSHEPVGEVTAFDNTDGSLGEPVTLTGTGSDYTGATEGDKIAVFYETEAPADSTVVTFSSDKFPSIYRVVGTSLVRDEDGEDHPFQFVIPRAKLQSGFTFTMDPENVSTFDFNLQVLVEQGTRKLYDVIRL